MYIIKVIFKTAGTFTRFEIHDLIIWGASQSKVITVVRTKVTL